MPTWIDATLYPDTDPPSSVATLADKVDFLARLCGAWDFGVLPTAATIAEVRRAEWRSAVEDCLLLTSPTYHLLREWHGLPAVPFLGQRIPLIADDPNLAYV